MYTNQINLITQFILSTIFTNFGFIDLLQQRIYLFSLFLRLLETIHRISSFVLVLSEELVIEYCVCHLEILL